jgi:hypothetical protein
VKRALDIVLKKKKKRKEKQQNNSQTLELSIASLVF